MEQVDNNFEELIQELENFKKSYLKINKLWDPSNIMLEDDYPFDRSFDELSIQNWVEKSIEKLTE